MVVKVGDLTGRRRIGVAISFASDGKETADG